VRTRSFGQKAVCLFTAPAVLLFLIQHEANEAERSTNAVRFGDWDVRYSAVDALTGSLIGPRPSATA